MLRPLKSVARFQAVRHAGLPSFVNIAPRVTLRASCALTENLVLHAYAGYLWEPANKLDAPAAARILVPGLVGQAVPVGLKPRRLECAPIGIAHRLFRRLSGSLTTVYGRLVRELLDDINVHNTELIHLTDLATVSYARGQGKGIASASYLSSPVTLADMVLAAPGRRTVLDGQRQPRTSRCRGHDPSVGPLRVRQRAPHRPHRHRSVPLPAQSVPPPPLRLPLALVLARHWLERFCYGATSR